MLRSKPDAVQRYAALCLQLQAQPRYVLSSIVELVLETDLLPLESLSALRNRLRYCYQQLLTLYKEYRSCAHLGEYRLLITLTKRLSMLIAAKFPRAAQAATSTAVQ